MAFAGTVPAIGNVDLAVTGGTGNPIAVTFVSIFIAAVAVIVIVTIIRKR